MKRYSILSAALASAICLGACSGGKPGANQNLSKPGPNSGGDGLDPSANPSKLDQPAPISLATPTDTYKTIYAAQKRQDLETLKKAFSNGLLKYYATADPAKSLDVQLRAFVEAKQGSTDSVRNETITGETATLEYLGPQDKWMPMYFVRQGDEWKLTLPEVENGGERVKLPAGSPEKGR